jgi:RNA-directed DNA polymerase
VDKLKPQGKSFDISKWEVWEAYRQVKANQGAPCVDGVTLEQFDEDLKHLCTGSGIGCRRVPIFRLR